MIEPLRYHIEKCPPFALAKPAFCQRCLSNKKTRDNPRLVIKYCEQCPRCQLLCQECDEYAHSFVKTKDHIRRIVVVGPAVRKKIHRRGDSRSFPQIFDIVEIKFKAKIIHNGKVVHRSKPHHLSYPTGISGQCVHIQILGAKRLPVADAHGSSDPFICVSFGGKRIGTTRTRPRTINPRWTNETYIIPVGTEEEHHSRPHKKSQDLVKLEVFDRDYFNFNDFLGHVEITKQQLLKLSYLSNQKPIRLSLGLREYHGRIALQFGINANLCYLKVLKAESLDKMDAIGLSDPFCEVYFKNKLLGRTNVCSNTLDPVWSSGNLFTFEVEEVLKEEIRLRALARLGQAHRMTSKSTNIFDNAFLFRIELFDYNSFRPHAPLGTIRISCDSFRRLAPGFPHSINEIEKGKSINHLLFTVRKARNSISSINPLVIAKPLGFSSSGGGTARDGGGGAGGGGGGDSNQMSLDNNNNNLNSNNSQLSESFKSKLAEIDKLDHIEEEEGGGDVDPSIADEEDERSIPEPKEPTFEFETNIPFNDEGNGDEDGRPLNDQEGNDDVDETMPLQQTRIPFLNIPRRRSLHTSEQESVGSSRHSKLTIHESEFENDDNENDRDRDNEKEDESEMTNPFENDAQLLPAMFGRTARSGTPRVTHNLPSFDDEEESGGRKSRTLEYASSNQNEESVNDQEREGGGGSIGDGGDDEGEEGRQGEEGEKIEQRIESQPLVRSEDSNTDDFFDEEPDEESPSFISQLSGNYERFKIRVIEKLKNLFPSTPAPTANRRQSIIQMLSKQRKSILDVTVGSTQWFPMKWFDIQKRVEDIVDAQNEDRGQIIVRLIPSMRGYVVRGLDVGVRHMTLGETSTIKVRYDYAYGNFWMGPEIPPRSNINFTVQLLSINGGGHILQIPWRLWLRFYRLMRRNGRRLRNGSVECYHGSVACWKALQIAYRNYRYGKPKVEEEEEFIEEIEDEGEYEETIEKEESSEESDDDFNVNDFNRGIIAGAGAMWGYDPKKRPKKVKKPKKPKGEPRSHGGTSGGDLTSRSRISQQSKSSKQSRVTIASTSSRNQRKLSKQSQSSTNGREKQRGTGSGGGTGRGTGAGTGEGEGEDEDVDEIAFENDDSASESSRHSRDSSSGMYSSSTTSRRKRDEKLHAIDESGHRTSTQHGRKRLSNASKRSR